MTGNQAGSPPKPGRIVMAFIMAPLAGTATFLAPMVVSMASDLSSPVAEAHSLEVNLTILRIVLIVALAYAFSATIIFGVPFYFLLRKKVSLSPIITAVTGGFVALMAALLLVMTDQGTRSDLADLGAALMLMATFSGCGLIAGLVFWVCAFWRNPASIKSVRP
jgi:hypothetical protein